MLSDPRTLIPRRGPGVKVLSYIYIYIYIDLLGKHSSGVLSDPSWLLDDKSS